MPRALSSSLGLYGVWVMAETFSCAVANVARPSNVRWPDGMIATAKPGEVSPLTGDRHAKS